MFYNDLKRAPSHQPYLPDLPFGTTLATNAFIDIINIAVATIILPSSVKFCVGVDLLIDYHVDPGTTGWLALAQECYLRS